VLQVPEIFNPRNPPPNHLDSKAGLRGAICGFIFKRREVTFQELHQKFGAYELDAALEGLFDREILDYRADGTYFLSPNPPKRQPPAVRQRLLGSR
jgi:hypothetical protein